MYVNLYFSKRPKEYLTTSLDNVENTTNERLVWYDKQYDVDNEDVFNFKYKLRDNVTVTRWLQQVQLNWGLWQDEENIKIFNYNNYVSPSWETIKTARTTMNNVIDEVNQMGWFEVPEELKLIVDDKQDTQLSKLNELHFIFENNLIEENERTGENIEPQLFRALESMNNLVHVCEKWDGNENPTVFNVFRMIEHDDLEWLHMADDDYNRMEIFNFGYIELDFGTIGKDLGTCFDTQDVELVKRQEIKQQEWIRPFLSQKFLMPKEPAGEWKPDHYYKWCEDNKVTDYGYNYKEPQYNLGRVILGEWVDRDKYDVPDVQRILSEYPTFEDIRLSEE
jgi:hypothetical protein